MRASLSMASSGDQLKAAAAVAQSLAIIVGVGVTLNEIVLKDRAADRSRLELSISFVDEIRNERVVNAQAMLHALHDTAYRTPVDFADQPMRDACATKSTGGHEISLTSMPKYIRASLRRRATSA